MQQVLDWCLNHWAVTVFILGCIWDITPMFKGNPIRAVLRYIGKLMTSDISKEITALKESVKENQEAIDANEKDRIRYEVLAFANSCRNGQNHTQDEFRHIIVLNDKYKALLKKTNDKNGVFEVEYDYIKKLYDAKMKDNSFL